MDGFSEFFAILGCDTHLKSELRPKLFKIHQNNLQTKCSALSVDFNGVRLDPLGSRSPYERIKFGYPLENVRFLLLSTNLAREWLQINRLVAYHNKHCWRAFRGYQNRWSNDLEPPKIWVLCDFSAILGCDAHLRANFRWNILEIDQDNLRSKLNWCCRASHDHEY